MIYYEAVPELVIVGFLSMVMVNMAIWAYIDMDRYYTK